MPKTIGKSGLHSNKHKPKIKQELNHYHLLIKY